MNASPEYESRLAAMTARSVDPTTRSDDDVCEGRAAFLQFGRALDRHAGTIDVDALLSNVLNERPTEEHVSTISRGVAMTNWSLSAAVAISTLALVWMAAISLPSAGPNVVRIVADDSSSTREANSKSFTANPAMSWDDDWDGRARDFAAASAWTLWSGSSIVELAADVPAEEARRIRAEIALESM